MTIQKAVFSIASDKHALLIELTITEDKDFGELVFRLQLPHNGILLIRIESIDHKISLVVSAIEKNYKEMINRFSVINNNKLELKNGKFSLALRYRDE